MNEISILNNLVTEIKFFENQAVTSYWEIGKRLEQAKEQVAHGEWGDWLKANLNYSQSTANKLMKVSSELSKSELIPNLSFTQALALTSVDEEIREEIIKNEDLENRSVTETKEIIKRYKENNKELEEENKNLKEANEILNEELRNETEKKVVEKTITKEVIKEVIPEDYENIKRENKILQDKNTKLELEYKVSKLNDNEEREKIKSELRNYKWLVLNFVKNTTPLLNIVDQVKLLPKEEIEILEKSTENLLGFANNLYKQLKGI
ncbi:DUF3102 domain-containing protein [Helcococcus kunzii]|uniref:DUF3102 domain-containing protein n=1 Tax=Helcococcus kunzii TaxID=40091 RepID=UPI0038A20799